jgi:hypothetical protein
MAVLFAFSIGPVSENNCMAIRKMDNFKMPQVLGSVFGNL